VVTHEHVDIETADRLFDCFMGCVCAQIACGRAHINAELLPQFFRPRVKILVEDVDQEKT